MLILSEADLRRLLPMRQVIRAVEEGFQRLASGRVQLPARLHLAIDERDAVLLEMPAYAAELPDQTPPLDAALGTKIVTVFPRNADRRLPNVQAVYLLLDSETGEPLAMMEGKFITAIRTAATSAVATKYLANPAPSILAILGAGVQAQAHIEAMAEATTIERVTISSRNPINAEALAATIRNRFPFPCEAQPITQAIRTANLICTCTNASTPLFDGRMIQPGTHINAVGAFTPKTREVDSETVRRARVYLDHERAAGREAGDLLIPLAEGIISNDHFIGALAEVVTGKVAGRQSTADITLFKSCGLAIEDLVTAQLAYRRAKAQQVGISVTL